MRRMGQIFIHVQHGRALVSRYLPFDQGYVTWETAKNALELEAAALEALKRRDVDLSKTGQYCCPPELALQAEFERIYQL